MEVHDGTLKSLIRALARGDLETLEKCAIAISKGDKVHADYRDEDMWPAERLLLAWRYSLPPYHKNPCRRPFVEARTREQRLIGCYAEIVLKGATRSTEPTLFGTILEDDGQSWLLSTRVPSVKGTGTIQVAIRIQLDSIAICEIRVNPAQLAAFRGHKGESAGEAQYFGLPDWSWFVPNQEMGLLAMKQA